MQFVDGIHGDEMFSKQSADKNKTELEKGILHHDKKFELVPNEIEGEVVLKKSTNETDGKIYGNTFLRQPANENESNLEVTEVIANEAVIATSGLGIVLQVDSEIFSKNPPEETQINPGINGEVCDQTGKVVLVPDKKANPAKEIVGCGTYPNLSTFKTETKWNASKENLNQNKEENIICTAKPNGDCGGCFTSIEVHGSFGGLEMNESKIRLNHNGQKEKIQYSVENILDGNKIIRNDTRSNGTCNEILSNLPMNLNILDENEITPKLGASKNCLKYAEDAGTIESKDSDQVNCRKMPFKQSRIIHDNGNVFEESDSYQENPSRCSKNNEIKPTQTLENDEIVILSLSPSEMITTTGMGISLMNNVGKESTFADPSSAQTAKPIKNEISIALQQEKSEICGRIPEGVKKGNQEIFSKRSDQLRSFSNKEAINVKYFSNSSKGNENLLKFKTKYHIHCMCKNRCCICFKNKMLEREDSIRVPNRIETFGRMENKHSNILKKSYSHSRISNPSTRSKFSSRKENHHCAKFFKEKFQLEKKCLTEQNASKKRHSSFGIENRNSHSNQFSNGRERKDRSRSKCLFNGKYYTSDLAHYVAVEHHNAKNPFRTLERLKTNKALNRKNYDTDFIKKTLEIRRLRSLVRRQVDEINNYVKHEENKRNLLTVGSNKLEKKFDSMHVDISQVDSEHFQGETNTLEEMELFLLFLKGRKRKLTANSSGLSSKEKLSNDQRYSKISASGNQKDLVIKAFYGPETKYEVNINEDKENPQNQFTNEDRNQGTRINIKPLKKLAKMDILENQLEKKRNRVHQIRKIKIGVTEPKQSLVDNRIIEHQYALGLDKSRKLYFNQETDTESLPVIFSPVTERELDRKVPERKNSCSLKGIETKISKYSKKSKNQFFNKDKNNKFSVLSDQAKYSKLEIKDNHIVFKTLPAERTIENASKNVKEYWNETTSLEEMEAFFEKLRIVRMAMYGTSKINYCIATSEPKEMTSDQIPDEKTTNIEGRIMSLNEFTSRDQKYAYSHRGDDKYFQKTVSNSSTCIGDNPVIRKCKFDDECVQVVDSETSTKVDEMRHLKKTNSVFEFKGEEANQTGEYSRNEKRPCYATDRSHKLFNTLWRKRIKLGKMHR